MMTQRDLIAAEVRDNRERLFQKLRVLGAYRNWTMIARRAVHELQLPGRIRAGMVLRGSPRTIDIASVHARRALDSTTGTLPAEGVTVSTVEVPTDLSRADSTRPDS